MSKIKLVDLSKNTNRSGGRKPKEKSQNRCFDKAGWNPIVDGKKEL